MTISQCLFKTNRMLAGKSSRFTIQDTVLILAFLAVLTTASVASATNYWVSTTGSDSNPGTHSAPWRHFSHAAATAVAGDTVIFMNGTYNNEGKVEPNYVVTLTNSGTASAPITFMAQHRGGAILDGGHNGGSTCTGAYAYINLASTSYIVIQGFVIQNTCDESIHNNDAASFITLRWNEFDNVATGIVTTSPYGRDSMFCDSAVHNIIVDGNSIHNIGRAPGQTSSLDHGLYIECQDVTIVNNIFYNQVDGWDIQFADGATNILIANNTFASHNPDQYGQVVIYDSTGSQSGLTFQNNIFYNPPTYAIYSYSPNVSNCEINTNLISNAAGVYDGNGCTVGTNLLDTNPDLANPTDYNFALLSGSPAIDAGIILAPVTTDFARACRPQGAGYDIGAYEYVESCN